MLFSEAKLGQKNPFRELSREKEWILEKWKV